LSDKPVLVDTSVWVELLRRSAHPMRPHLDSLVNTDRARLCGVIIAELLQGAVGPKEISAVEELANAVPLLESNDQTWIASGRLSHRLRQQGTTVGLVDCYIAALAQDHRCLLLSLDKHFPIIAKHFPLELDPAASVS
jgi:predicted nucleic acid-binding protein